MGIQKSVIKFTGTVGELNGYYDNGKYILRKAGGGFNGERIKNDPKMVRVRENYTEFGFCSKANKAFRFAIHDLLHSLPDKYLFRRLVRTFTKIKDLDTGKLRGQRRMQGGIMTLEGQQKLIDFAFTLDEHPKDHLGGTWEVDWDAATLSIGSLKSQRVPFPKNATFLQLEYGVLAFDYDSFDFQLTLENPVLLPRDFMEEALSMSFEVPTHEGVKHLFIKLHYMETHGSELFPLQESQAMALIAMHP